MTMNKKKRKPKFNVMNYGFMKSVKARWRKPRGVDNKKKIRLWFTGACPRIGYGTPAALKNRHPSGKLEMMVNNLAQLDAAKKADAIVRIAAAVGKRKRQIIVTKAHAIGVRIINL